MHIYIYMGWIYHTFGLKNALKDILWPDSPTGNIEIREGVDWNALRIKININDIKWSQIRDFVFIRKINLDYESKVRIFSRFNF